VPGKAFAQFVDADMPVVAHVDEAGISSPGIGVEDGFDADFSLDDRAQNLRGSVGHDLGIDAAVALVDAEDRLLEGATALLSGPGLPRTRWGPK
jgi:hypothetical protein